MTSQLQQYTKDEYVEVVVKPSLMALGDAQQREAAISNLLTYFTAANFTGRVALDTVTEGQFSSFWGLDIADQRIARDWLAIDGETLHDLTVESAALLVLWTYVQTPACAAGALIRLRIAMVYQNCLTRRSHTLYKVVTSLAETLTSSATPAPHVLVECGLAYHYYYEFEDSWAIIQRAAKLTELSVSEGAMLGVRTRWQTFQTAQFVVDASSAAVQEQMQPRACPLPSEVEGESDGHDLFTRPRSEATSDAAVVDDLHPVHLAILMGMCMDIERDNPHHELTREHMEGYVQRVLANKNQTWSTKAMALLLRTRLERARGRTAQRSLLQLQQLVDLYTEDQHLDRTQLIHLVAYPTYWQMKRELADRYFDENLFKTAMEYYEHVRHWEGIIACATKLERRNSVENLALELLKDDPTNVNLWVAVGLATREREPLDKAWELSQHKSASAARAIAQAALQKEDYEEAIKYFDACAALNPTFGGDWFVLGYAALKLQRWDRAAEAYTRVVQLEPTDGFSWNNLGMALIRLNRTRPAFNALSQALRYHRVGWQIWQNYFSLAVELGELGAALSALKSLTEQGGRKFDVDIQSLRALVGLVLATVVPKKEDVPEASKSVPSAEPVLREGEEACDVMPLGWDDDDLKEAQDAQTKSVHPVVSAAPMTEAGIDNVKQRFSKCLGELTAINPFHADLFCVCAEYYDGLGDALKTHDYRVREYRAALKENWNTEEVLFKRVVQSMHSMIRAAEGVADQDPIAAVSTARYSHQVLELSKPVFGDTAEWKGLEAVAPPLPDEEE